MRARLLAALGVAGLLTGLVVAGSPGEAADHLEAPLVQADGRTDINDIYAFRSPDDPDQVVLIMTVNPGAGVLSPTTFDPEAKYRFQIDTDGDARADEKITLKFGPVRDDGSQRVRVKGAGGKGRGDTGDEIALSGGGRAIVSTFDDPFFFDLQAFLDQVKGAGGTRTFADGDEVDFFAGLNVSAIVLEMPSKLLVGSGHDDHDHGDRGNDDDMDDSIIGVWGETKTGAGRVDSMGRPAIATVLIDDGSEDAFNATRPHRHLEKFGDQVRGNLVTLSGLDGTGYTTDEAQAITEVLLPDILTIDVRDPSGFLNGRGPADDVIDAELPIVTGGFFGGSPVLTTDGIDANDVAFPGTFPYLAPAH